MKTERDENLEVILAEAPEGTTAERAAAFLDAVEPRAKRLHRLYALACNRPLNKREEASIPELEGVIRDEFRLLGLGLYLNGDPRGNPVGILTPKSRRYNTMGGAEAGWRL